jgi:hypothetical protein
LREAVVEQQQAFEHMERAQQAHRRAIALLLEADSARERALTPFAVEGPPPWLRPDPEA